jgi:hypothetical protein
MLSPDLLQRFIFVAPLPLIAVLALTTKFPWRMAVYILLAGTFAQDALSFALCPGHFAVKELPVIILSFYPFALYPLGIWSAILGVLGWWLIARLKRPLMLGPGSRVIAGALVGAPVGAAFAFTCAYLLEMNGPIIAAPGTLHEPSRWLCWEIAGLVAGAIDGAIIAAFLPREKADTVSGLQPGVEPSC